MPHKVLWSEGMFLQPQHFQQQERYFDHLVYQRSKGLYKWGIEALEIDSSLLPLGKIGLKTCRGLFPDGTPFDIPHHQPAPPPIALSEGQEVVYLTLPLRREGRPESGPGCLYPYTPYSVTVNDNLSEELQSTEMAVGQPSLKLQTDQQDLTGYQYLGVARLTPSLSLDSSYIPPCLWVQYIPALRELMQEVYGLLHFRGQALIKRITPTGYGGAAEVRDFILLQTIHRYETLIQVLLQNHETSPESFFFILTQLTGELLTFTQAPAPVAQYRHTDLAGTFRPLLENLRKALSMVSHQQVLSLNLQKEKYGNWHVKLDDPSLLEKGDLFLAVKASVTPEDLQTKFLKQLKIAPLEEINALVARSLPGIQMTSLPAPPRQLPFMSGFHYFSFNRHDPLWQHIQKSTGLAFHISGFFPDLEMALWLIKSQAYDI